MNEDRFLGTIFGQAVGDALGLGMEGMFADTMVYGGCLKDYSQIVADAHRSHWYAGDWTDDTDMMLCILKSYVSLGKIDCCDIARRFKQWLNYGGCGVGGTVFKVLSMPGFDNDPHKAAQMVWTIDGSKSAANGGVMRTSVVGLLPEAVEEKAVDVCRITHWDPRCTGSCAVVAALIHSLVYEDKALDYHELCAITNGYDPQIVNCINLAKNAPIEALQLDDNSCWGYTLKTLGAALWAYWHALSFEDGLLSVVNAGDDADTNAAVAGALLGAKFGRGSIPVRLVDGLRRNKELNCYAHQLWHVVRQENPNESDPYNLKRFLNLQQSTYPQALDEIKHGRKDTHWMWFIFPVETGIGQSPMAQEFAIRSINEAVAYLSHPVLGERLKEITYELTLLENKTAEEIFGSTDAWKLHASMTLFAVLSPKHNLFSKVLRKYYNGQPQQRTMKWLSKQ